MPKITGNCSFKSIGTHPMHNVLRMQGCLFGCFTSPTPCMIWGIQYMTEQVRVHRGVPHGFRIRHIISIPPGYPSMRSADYAYQENFLSRDTNCTKMEKNGPRGMQPPIPSWIRQCLNHQFGNIIEIFSYCLKLDQHLRSLCRKNSPRKYPSFFLVISNQTLGIPIDHGISH